MRKNLFSKARFALCFASAVFLFGLSAISSAFSQSPDSKQSKPFYKTSAVADVSGNFSNDEYEIFNLVNNERRKKRLADLYWDDELARIARKYSQQMARQHFFSHYDSDGKSVIDRANSAKIKGWSKIGENLFYCEGVDDFDNLAVKGWMKSPGHRQNILDNAWTSTGIGIALSNDGKIFVTQIFLRKLADN